MKPDRIKETVKEKYSLIARQNSNSQGCCGPSSCCGELEFSMIGDEYLHIEGYVPEADLGLGCGLPTEFSGIKPGDAVLDLGSGAGNDCFVARRLTGAEGSVTGIDFSQDMLIKANLNLEKTGFTNIRFIQGDIEAMPLPSSTFDVVISNCVLNLVPDKDKAFTEIFRVLKPGGRFCISDVVLSGNLPAGLKEAAELYAGCVSGAMPKSDYLKSIEEQGFNNIMVRKEKPITIPDDVLSSYLSEQEMMKFKTSGTGIYSITVTAEKV
jgi:arsenite methyltransferase